MKEDAAKQQMQKIQARVDSTKAKLIEMLDDLFIRGKKITQLKKISDDQVNVTLQFSKNAKELRIQQQIKNWTYKLTVLGGIFGLIYGLLGGGSTFLLMFNALCGGGIMWVASKLLGKAWVGLSRLSLSFASPVIHQTEMTEDGFDLSQLLTPQKGVIPLFDPSTRLRTTPDKSHEECNPENGLLQRFRVSQRR